MKVLNRRRSLVDSVEVTERERWSAVKAGALRSYCTVIWHEEFVPAVAGCDHQRVISRKAYRKRGRPIAVRRASHRRSQSTLTVEIRPFSHQQQNLQMGDDCPTVGRKTASQRWLTQIDVDVTNRCSFVPHVVDSDKVPHHAGRYQTNVDRSRPQPESKEHAIDVKIETESTPLGASLAFHVN